MYQVILFVHVFVAICIVALVLVQQGKGATVGAAFGSGASQTVFGSRGSGSFLFRATIAMVVLFFTTSILLNYLTVHAFKQEKALPFVVTPARHGPASNALPQNSSQDGTKPKAPVVQAPTKGAENGNSSPLDIPVRR